MKNTATFRLLSMLCLLCLSTLLGCGDTEDTEERMEATGPVTGLVTEPLTEEAREASDAETFTPIALSDIPHNWYKTKDPKRHGDYFHSILIDQFGDIPEVHIVAAYHKKRLQGIPTSVDAYDAYLEASNRLWPKPNPPRKVKEMFETEDPEVFAKLFREQLLKQFGDVPEIDILVKVEKKWKAGHGVNPGEYIAYAHAMFHLFPSDSTRRALELALKMWGEAQDGNANGIDAAADDDDA